MQEIVISTNSSSTLIEAVPCRVRDFIFMAMGGGSMMRAAAKVAGIGVVNSGLRGGVVPDGPISAAARAAARPIGAFTAKSSSDSVKAGVASDAASAENPCLQEIDDWEFADGVEEILNRRGDPLPRLVFGGAPTIEEAKEATTELKDALEKVFASSPRSSGYESLSAAGHSSALSHFSNSDVLENKACTTSGSSTPKHAIQAFRFLDQSPEVQGVVASIASDPNVWEAVLQNPALQDYLQSHIATCSNAYQKVGESFTQGEVFYQESPRSFEVFSGTGKTDGEVLYQTSPRSFDVLSGTGKSEAGESNSTNELLHIWKNIKLAVVDMMNNLSGFFSSLFGVQGDSKVTANPSPFPGVVEKLLGPSLIGVVVMVIMVVVLKRV